MEIVNAHITPSWIVGDKVEKDKGFKFPGEVRAVFRTKAGLKRVVVEADHPEFQGMLHIYNPEQLRSRDVR